MEANERAHTIAQNCIVFLQYLENQYNINYGDMNLFIDHEVLEGLVNPDTIHDASVKGQIAGVDVYVIPLECGLDAWCYAVNKKTGERFINPLSRPF